MKWRFGDADLRTLAPSQGVRVSVWELDNDKIVPDPFGGGTDLIGYVDIMQPEPGVFHFRDTPRDAFTDHEFVLRDSGAVYKVWVSLR